MDLDQLGTAASHDAAPRRLFDDDSTTTTTSSSATTLKHRRSQSNIHSGHPAQRRHNPRSSYDNLHDVSSSRAAGRLLNRLGLDTAGHSTFAGLPKPSTTVVANASQLLPGSPLSPSDLGPLINTASAARWHRRSPAANRRARANTYSTPPLPRTSTVASTAPSTTGAKRYREQDLTAVRLVVMEEVHGVDVSWLHHPHQDPNKQRRHHPSASKSTPSKNADSPVVSVTPSKLQTPTAPQPVAPPKGAQSTLTHANNEEAQSFPSQSTPLSKSPNNKRPGLAKTPSSDDTKSGSRRQSWMNSISSKFSSSTPERPTSTLVQPTKSSPSAASGATSPGVKPIEATEAAAPYISSKPKDSSFFSSLTRRLSTASQSSGIPKVQGTGGVCPRRVLNVDPNRERCLVPEMDPSRLRRVSFCVDVEIAGGPRYSDDDEDDDERLRKKKEFKMKERAEGEALKHPEAIKEEKDEDGEPKLEEKSKAVSLPVTQSNGTSEKGGYVNGSPPKDGAPNDEAAQRKREKKKRSEEERKERKEKRRRRAEENGQVPVEMSPDDQNGDDSTAPNKLADVSPHPGSTQLPRSAHPTPQLSQQMPNNSKPGRLTTDPVRIYRRCCQLRESPILKRITEQLMAPTCIAPQEPGVVGCLDLRGSRLQTADFATLGDWLAVVPVKKLLLEDADLNDEGVRCVLAGLLAAKKPQPLKRRSTTPKHREGLARQVYQERSGVIEKLTLKNNPRISRAGWKHIVLFLYMCRSIKAIDLSMNQFPDTLPSHGHTTSAKNSNGSLSPPTSKASEMDAAETMYQCLSERLGGSKLEELIVSECGVSTPQLRKIVDGAMVCGITRLGLAGNHLDDDGLEHVMLYLRSSICHGLDLGSNDLRGRTNVVAAALQHSPEAPCWGLSLAGCNLDSASLKALFPALSQLPSFRFIDLSHNPDLFADNDTVSLLRRNLVKMKELKRIHLADCGMSPKQAIALADALPDAPRLAHLSLLQNPQLTALANAKTEAQQEEACALYASLMAAVRVSSTLICVDIDVPSQDNSEVVKALAKQVVAYSLRNMEQFAIADITGDISATTANATSALTSAYGGEEGMKDSPYPDVLMQLVGHVEGLPDNHDNDDPAPDEDYIVGGTGVVKALQYVLGEKANDHRGSISNSPRSGSLTPTQRPNSANGPNVDPRARAKKMSAHLLGSARKIRDRLKSALAKEAASGDELAYYRLLFLDQTLQSIVQRFEEEYPETREATPSTSTTFALPNILFKPNVQSDESGRAAEEPSPRAGADSDEDELDDLVHPHRIDRHNSDVSLAGRAQVIEEGHLHRMGQQLRREMIDSPRGFSAEGTSRAPWVIGGSESPSSGAMSTAPSAKDTPSTTTTTTTTTDAVVDDTNNNKNSSSNNNNKMNNNNNNKKDDDENIATNIVNGTDNEQKQEADRLRVLGNTLESLSGSDLKRHLFNEGRRDGWDDLLARVGGSYDDLRRLQEEDPEAWELFKESQAKAQLNISAAGNTPASDTGTAATGPGADAGSSSSGLTTVNDGAGAVNGDVEHSKGK